MGIDKRIVEDIHPCLFPLVHNDMHIIPCSLHWDLQRIPELANFKIITIISNALVALCDFRGIRIVLKHGARLRENKPQTQRRRAGYAEYR
jgi:hypothetical protein